MKNIFIIAGFISIIFLIFKIYEMKMIEKENKPMKILFKDALIVYFSVLIGDFLIIQIMQLMEGGTSNINKSTPVFTDNPGF